MKSMLRTFGYTIVATFANGEDALEKIPQLVPDLVFLDIRLAGTLDGVEVARCLLQKSQFPIVFLTAYNEEIYKEPLETIPAVGVLHKPFGMEELEEFLRNHKLLVTNQVVTVS